MRQLYNEADDTPSPAPDWDAAAHNPDSAQIESARTGQVFGGDRVLVSLDMMRARDTDTPDNPIHSDPEQARQRAAFGVEWAIRNAQTGEVPSPEDSEFYTEGLDIFNTGVTLITNEPMEGVESITAEEGKAICWG